MPVTDSYFLNNYFFLTDPQDHHIPPAYFNANDFVEVVGIYINKLYNKYIGSKINGVDIELWDRANHCIIIIDSFNIDSTFQQFYIINIYKKSLLKK